MKRERGIMKREHGFSMLEVLITMLIVSFGLLGIAGIIITSVKNNQSSNVRSQASLMVNDILDRMRANRTPAEGPSLPYDLLISTPTATTAPPAGPNIAASDLYSWRTALAATLPSGTGSIKMNPATKNVTVVVQWNDSHGGDRDHAGASTESLTVQARL